MRQAAVAAPPTGKPEKSMHRQAVLVVLLGALVIPLLWIALWSYQQEIQDPTQRVRCLVVWIIAGAAATACLCGAMIYLNRIREGSGIRWLASLPLLLVQRAILIAQFATSGVALVSVGLMMFDFPIPPPAAILHPHVTALPEGRQPPPRSPGAPRSQLSTRPQSAPSMPQRLRQLFGE